jgi:hypothetical protein
MYPSIRTGVLAVGLLGCPTCGPCRFRRTVRLLPLDMLLRHHVAWPHRPRQSFESTIGLDPRRTLGGLLMALCHRRRRRRHWCWWYRSGMKTSCFGLLLERRWRWRWRYVWDASAQKMGFVEGDAELRATPFSKGTGASSESWLGSGRRH